MFRKTMEEYEADTRKKLVIDIREKEAFDKETMPGALHMDSETLKQQIKLNLKLELMRKKKLLQEQK